MRKNLATTVTTILCAMLFIIIGSCFSTFLYQKEIIKVENPKVFASNTINVLSEKGDKKVSELKLSKLKLGLKPATGEEDLETNIPVTVHEKKGSEGQFAKFKLFAPNATTIYIDNIKIKSKNDVEKVKEERENIFVSIKQMDNSTKSLKDDKVILGTTEPSDERKEYTFYIWLSAKAGDELKASTISFDIHFEEQTT